MLPYHDSQAIKINGIDTYTMDTMYKIDNKWEPTVEHRELYSTLCGDLKGRNSKKKGYMYTYSWFILLYFRNSHILKQQYSNENFQNYSLQNDHVCVYYDQNLIIFVIWLTLSIYINIYIFTDTHVHSYHIYICR